ncbi:PRD domain-containing protein [Ligilactobacillus sp. LYQ139]|uniref:PRD domain-containing protein n=1 Tax=Ligilactobacillus sp. LYQ139 TaxID=3378800 RepID=UPI0038621374
MSIEEIAWYEGRSSRTCEKRIKELNDILQGIAVIKRRSEKYSLVILDYARFWTVETKGLKRELDLNDPCQRQAFILEYLISRHSWCSYDELANAINISVKTVRRDIVRLKERLTALNVQCNVKPGRGIKLTAANQLNILFALRDCAINVIDIDDVIPESFESVLNLLGLSANIKRWIKLNLKTLIKAHSFGFSLEGSNNGWQPIWNTQKSQKIIDNVNDLLPNLTNAEQDFLLMPLMIESNQLLDSALVQEEMNANFLRMNKWVKAELSGCNLIFQNVYNRIKWHLLFLIGRVRAHIDIDQILPHNVIRKYPVAYELGRKIALGVTELCGMEVSINELAYLVVYFQMLLEEKRSGLQGVRIAYVGKIRTALREFICEKVKKVLGTIDVDEYFTPDDFQNSKKRYLLVFSERPFECSNGVLVDINMVFRGNVLASVIDTSMVEYMDNIHLCHISVMKIEADEYYNAVDETIQELIVEGQLSDDFRKNWVNRGSAVDNLFPNGIAVPHAVDAFQTSKVVLGIGIIKRPFKYKEMPVRLIFVIGMPEQLNDELVSTVSRIYDLITSVAHNKVLYNNLLNYDPSKPFVQIIEGI